MWEDILGQLTKLSKEQLIYIIEQYRKATLRMSNALVRESMCYIHSTDACDIIRIVYLIVILFAIMNWLPM